MVTADITMVTIIMLPGGSGIVPLGSHALPSANDALGCWRYTPNSPAKYMRTAAVANAVPTNSVRGRGSGAAGGNAAGVSCVVAAIRLHPRFRRRRVAVVQSEPRATPR